MSKYGKEVEEPYAHGGLVMLDIRDYDARAVTSISPDEARLLALRLIKTADEAEGQEEW
ncbi:hypothetical protein [Streptomyces sp. DH12]|uniref:hypothetical protein n=1 Tax=Streptomyces sp. DH12 TaxID=2857010 RepID=UPI001E5F54D7|nr:hypothetical protein [Streptomyces sp. DH12]